MDIFEKIDSGYYTSTYIKKPVKPEVWWKRVSELTADEAECVANALSDYNAKMLAYNAELKKARQRQQELDAEFKRDALEYVGLTDHPKASDIAEFAWSEKHSYSYREVVMFLAGLSNLFKD